MTTEIGRQPWLVYGLMRTADVRSPMAAPAVASSLIAFIIVYFVVFTAGIDLPAAHDGGATASGRTGPSHEVPTRTAGITPAAGAAAEGAAR